MKKLFLSLMFVSCFAFASGKLSMGPTYYLQAQKLTPSFGLAIYEPLFAGLNYNAWTGIGWDGRSKDSSMYLTSKHDIETYFGEKWGASVGYTFNHSEKSSDMFAEHNVHAKIIYKLW